MQFKKGRLVKINSEKRYIHGKFAIIMKELNPGDEDDPSKWQWYDVFIQGYGVYDFISHVELEDVF